MLVLGGSIHTPIFRRGPSCPGRTEKQVTSTMAWQSQDEAKKALAKAGSKIDLGYLSREDVLWLVSVADKPVCIFDFVCVMTL
jgi:hypothetical protein